MGVGLPETGSTQAQRCRTQAIRHEIAEVIQPETDNPQLPSPQPPPLRGSSALESPSQRPPHLPG